MTAARFPEPALRGRSADEVTSAGSRESADGSDHDGRTRHRPTRPWSGFVVARDATPYLKPDLRLEPNVHPVRRYETSRQAA